MGGGALGTLVAAQKALRKHVMPFGAEVLGDGGVRFRLWAPGAQQVDLVLQQQAKPMRSVGQGWYEAVEKARDAGVGLALVKNTTHTAALGYYTLMGAEGGMAALALAASTPTAMAST